MICFESVPSDFHEFKRSNFSQRKDDMVIRDANAISLKNELSTAISTYVVNNIDTSMVIHVPSVRKETDRRNIE